MKEKSVNGYFDHNATTSVFPSARDALFESLDSNWHNPSSLYPAAGRAKHLLEEARESLAHHLGIEDEQRILFTSGATESNNLVFRHLATETPDCNILISEIEHPSVLEPATCYFPDQHKRIPVNKAGVVDLEVLRNLLAGKRVGLVSVMAANNETGVLQPWEEVRAIAREKGSQFHCDATQWLGKLDSTNFGQCDWLSGSAHKFGGPKGIGFLVVPPGLENLQGTQFGGPQERGLRAGTENYPAIAAMVEAFDCAVQMAENAPLLESDRDAFEGEIQKNLPGTRLLGTRAPRLWNTSMVIVPEHKNLKWLTRLGELGFALSTGSACSSGRGNPSHVMQAMGLDFDQMGRVLRISGGWETTGDDWKALAQAFGEVSQNLNAKSIRKSRSQTISLTDINPLH
jgi:cysteine desulfurase